MHKKDALAHFGTLKAVAEAIGVTLSAVSQWDDDRPIPEASAYRLWLASGGSIPFDARLYRGRSRGHRADAA